LSAAPSDATHKCGPKINRLANLQCESARRGKGGFLATVFCKTVYQLPTSPQLQTQNSKLLTHMKKKKENQLQAALVIAANCP